MIGKDAKQQVKDHHTNSDIYRILRLVACRTFIQEIIREVVTATQGELTDENSFSITSIHPHLRKTRSVIVVYVP